MLIPAVAWGIGFGLLGRNAWAAARGASAGFDELGPDERAEAMEACELAPGARPVALRLGLALGGLAAAGGVGVGLGWAWGLAAAGRALAPVAYLGVLGAAAALEGLRAASGAAAARSSLARALGRLRADLMGSWRETLEARWFGDQIVVVDSTSPGSPGLPWGTLETRALAIGDVLRVVEGPVHEARALSVGLVRGAEPSLGAIGEGRVVAEVERVQVARVEHRAYLLGLAGRPRHGELVFHLHVGRPVVVPLDAPAATAAGAAVADWMRRGYGVARLALPAAA